MSQIEEKEDRIAELENEKLIQDWHRFFQGEAEATNDSDEIMWEVDESAEPFNWFTLRNKFPYARSEPLMNSAEGTYKPKKKSKFKIAMCLIKAFIEAWKDPINWE